MRSESLSATRPNRLSERELALLFYLGVPVFLGLLFGWIGAGPLGGQLPRPIAIIYWIIGFLFARIALETSIRLIALVAPKQKTPLIVLCILSVPLHMIIGAPLFYLWKAMFLGYLPPGVEIVLPSLWIGSMGAFLLGLRANTMVMLEWTLTNLLFDRVLDFPRFRTVTGYSPPFSEPTNEGKSVQEPTEYELPKFLRRVPSKLGTEVIALSAEDHYVRVHTTLGSDLIFCRFSDAVSEMPNGLGMQIHRSHWVRTSAIADFWKEGNLYRISINDELDFPVSKRFLGLLKANGWEPKEKT